MNHNPEPIDIDDKIHKKREELMGIHATLAIYLAMKVPHNVAAKINELQDRLEYRIKESELQLLEHKCTVYTQALEILREVKPTLV